MARIPEIPIYWYAMYRRGIGGTGGLMTADLRDPAYWDTAILRSAGRLFMLAALAERPGHGYDIARRLSSLCGNWCKPSDAMIYPAIHDLEAAGLISCKLDEDSARRRRVCSLTAAGEDALRTGAEAWARFLPAITQVIGEAGVEALAGDACEGLPGESS